MSAARTAAERLFLHDEKSFSHIASPTLRKPERNIQACDQVLEVLNMGQMLHRMGEQVLVLGPRWCIGMGQQDGAKAGAIGPVVLCVCRRASKPS